jgi:hypothetical protein
MSKKPRILPKAKPERWYRGADVPMSVIRRYAPHVAARFQPETIILFGSYFLQTPAQVLRRADDEIEREGGIVSLGDHVAGKDSF